MFEYRLDIVNPYLNQEDKVHVYLLDLLFMKELEKLNSCVQRDKEFYSLDLDLFLYLIKDNADIWRLTLSYALHPDRPTQYQYKAVKNLSLSAIAHMVNNEADRHRILKELMPVKGKFVEYPVIPSYNSEFN